MLHEGPKSQVPKRTRNRRSRFEGTADWRMLKARIDARIKRDRAVWVEIPVRTLDSVGISNRRSVARFIQKYVKSKELPYTVESETRGDNILVTVKH